MGRRSPSSRAGCQPPHIQYNPPLDLTVHRLFLAIGNRSPSPKDFLQQAKDCGDDFCILAGHLSRQQFTLKAIVSPDLTKQQVTLKGKVSRDCQRQHVTLKGIVALDLIRAQFTLKTLHLSKLFRNIFANPNVTILCSTVS